ncbi:MAG: RluA family pseudouridine synthase [Chloroflexi bacterium]|nr:RluA family pseudouridine synthase [Chloroflexota bacterium]
MNPADLILWQDADLLAVNKPAGLPTLPDGYQPDAPCLVAALQAAFGRVWVVHRLDKETSGVIVLARTAEAHRALNAQFRDRETVKTYHALVVGDPPWIERTVKLPLRSDGDRRHRTVVDARKGKPTVTHLRVLERFTVYSLLEASPETGRTHQIRAHLAALGFPLVGDLLYASKDGALRGAAGAGLRQPLIESAPLQRLGLHAWSLTITHPVTGDAMRFESPYPEDFAAAVERLRRGRRPS